MVRFETTQWSLVLAAREQDKPGGAQTGRNRRRRRRLTQGFFASLLEPTPLEHIDPAAGRFRSFLLASFRNFLAHEHDKDTALKRGGRQSPVSLDVKAGEALFRSEPRDDWTPERAFERNWALALLRRVGERLEAELVKAGKGHEYRALAGFVTGEGSNRPYREIAQTVGKPEDIDRAATVRRFDSAEVGSAS